MNTYQKICLAFKDWMLEKGGHAELTQYFYLRIIHSFLNYLENFNVLRLNDVDPDFLSQFIQFRNNTLYSASSIKSRVAALDLFFSWAYQKRYCLQNPVLSYKKAKIKSKPLEEKAPKSDQPVPTSILSFKEQQILANLKVGSDFLEIRDKSIVLLLLASGLFAEEMRTLSWHDFHLEKGYLDVRGKNKRERRVNIQLALCQKIIKQWLKVRAQILAGNEHPMLFFTQTLRPLSKRVLYRIVSEYMAKAGIHRNPTGADVLRQTAICNMFKSKYSLEEIQRNTGIDTLTTLANYQQIAAHYLK